jgi:hypothetical protein
MRLNGMRLLNVCRGTFVFNILHINRSEQLSTKNQSIAIYELVGIGEMSRAEVRVRRVSYVSSSGL